MTKEIDDLIHYAIEEGYIGDEADEWTDEQKQSYFDKCNAYDPKQD